MSGEDFELRPESDLAQSDLVGARLTRAREALGLTREDVIVSTRIQRRYVGALEESNYAAFPARTYAIGFARTYAQKVGLNPAEIVRDLRAELGEHDNDLVEPATPTFTPGDPARVPSARFAALATAAAVILAGGGFLLWHTLYVPDASLPSLVNDAPAPPPAVQSTASAPQSAASTPSGTAAQAAPAGPVVFTALDSGLWVKFYDAAGKTLMNKQMNVGETYTVPADAVGPMVWTGRPDALAFSIGGHNEGKLAQARGTVRDVPVNAAALLARVAVPAGQTTGQAASGTAVAQGNAAGAPGGQSPASLTPSAHTASSHPTHHALPRAAATGAAQGGAQGGTGPTTAQAPDAATKASTVSE